MHQSNNVSAVAEACSFFLYDMLANGQYMRPQSLQIATMRESRAKAVDSFFMLHSVPSVQKHGPVERIPLHGLEAGVADDSSQFFFRSAVAGAGGSDYIFFEHHRAYVVAAEVKA
jgi:hypothetical protein